MTDLLAVDDGDRVLEVGTGLGYHAAILSELAGRGAVFTVEIVEELGLKAEEKLQALGNDNVAVRIGDGSRGWVDKGPFDVISVTAAPELLPAALFHQLKPGGRMVCPAGVAGSQQLLFVSRDLSGKLTVREVLPVNFMPLESGS
jgi:protein-L-isoaspartate(D-aspartate) O-methyltransferase